MAISTMKQFNPEDFLILVVDDINQNLQVIGEILEKIGYDTTFATSGEQALERVQAAQPDLILLDLMMPGINGLEVCQQLKNNPKFEEVPIIFLTASNEKEHLLAAFDKGAVDYVTKPFNAPELLARVRTHLELKKTREELKAALYEQSRLIEKLEKLATTDPLTGIWNRRYLLSKAEYELDRAIRYQSPFSVLTIDLDKFKQINDLYGHALGDEVLIDVTKNILKLLRKVDCFGRMGGEEFAILLPETDILLAVNVAERIRQQIANLVFNTGDAVLQITACIGVSNYILGNKHETVDAILQRADKALYQAKKQGRDRVIAYESEPH
ncbi:MAG TPA: diguanylate cyclase [Leptolyngbyaceae cyanobacterium]